jgi:hypothetical protein
MSRFFWVTGEQVVVCRRGRGVNADDDSTPKANLSQLGMSGSFQAMFALTLGVESNPTPRWLGMSTDLASVPSKVLDLLGLQKNQSGSVHDELFRNHPAREKSLHSGRAS